MPGHAGSPYWVAVDFDSDGEDDQGPPSNNRVYLDPWDNEAVGMIQGEALESSQEENMNSFAGEPVSASFYYVPTKNYDSGEEITAPPMRNAIHHEAATSPEYVMYNRKLSRTPRPDYSDMAMYGYAPIPDRRRSVYIDDPVYASRPIMYEPIYAPVPPPGYLPPPPRTRMSLPHHPEYMMANLGYGKHRRHSRMAEAYEPFVYESVPPDYDDWARPMPKTAPNNFHLSRFGHLQIDYSCSWNSLDRLIRNH